MSNTTPPPARAAGTSGTDSHLTVEDAGSTTDAADLVHDDGGDRAAAHDGDRGEGTSAGVMSAGAGDDAIGHVFDQTNGVIDGLDGDADGTAGSDDYSSADRGDQGGTLDGAEPLGDDENR